MSAILDHDLMPTGETVSHPVRPFFWCVKRELWENRSVLIAPAAVAVLVAGAYLIGTVHLPQIMSANPRMEQGSDTAVAGLPFSIATGAVVATGILTGIFYSLSALYTERRDRSILFWKSLPISDSTIVASKAFIPLVVLPAVIFAVTLIMQLVMLGMAELFAYRNGASFPQFWTQWPFVQEIVVLLYGLAAMALWHAPIYGWLFLVSAWAKRAPFLWAVLPVLALCVAEQIGFDSSVLSNIIYDRIGGFFNAAFSSLQAGGSPITLSQIAPLQFVSSADFWIGLLVAAGFFLGAIRLRRLHGPL